jgi:hypothetical protein
MRITLSWDVANADPAIRAWRIYGNPEPTLNVREQFIRELPVSESRCTFDVQEGAWKFVVLGVKREETETPFETASGTRGGLFFARGVKNVPNPPEEVGGGLVGEGELRVEVKARAPDEQPNKVQLIGGPPTSVYSIGGPGFGHLLEEFAEARADLLADDIARSLSHGRRAEGQGMAVDRRLWVRSISYDGTPSTSVERTLYPPERAHLDGRVVASIDGVAGTYAGFPAPAANDGWEASATYGFRARALPVSGDADWSDFGAVGGSGIFSSLLTLGRYVDNAKIRTNEIDLGAVQLFQLDTYHEAHRRDSVWGSKPMSEWNAVPAIPCEFRRMRNDRDHAGWTMREMLVGGEPRQPLRNVWWEYVAGTSPSVPTSPESVWKRLVPGQWIRARYFRVRLRFEEYLPWFRFATGNVQIAVLRSRLVTPGTGTPEGSIEAPIGGRYIDTGTVPPREYVKTTATGNTGWTRVDVPLLDSVNSATTLSSSSSLATIYSKSVPAGTLGTAGRVRLVLFGYYLNNTGAARNLLLEVLFGSSSAWKDTLVAIPTSAGFRPFRMEVELAAYGATGAQKVHGRVYLGDPTAPTTGIGPFLTPLADAAFQGDATEDSTTAKTLAVKAQHSFNNLNLALVVTGATAEQLIP